MLFPTECKNPYVFVVGCPRSGTTLLRRILDAHPELAMLETEQHWIVRYYARRKKLTAEGNLTNQFLDTLFQHEKFLKLKIDQERIEKIVKAHRDLSYSRLIEIIFNLYGELHEKSLVGDKTPENAKDIPILSKLWPSAKFVHMIRDGRDVALSAVSWNKAERLKRNFTTWNEQPILTAALWWSAYVRAARTAGASIGSGQYYEIRYEALIADPVSEIEKLCGFLNLAYSSRMIHYYDGRNQKGKDAKHSWLPITAGLRDWHAQMTIPDRQMFETAAGDLLKELGYEVAYAQSVTNHCFNNVRSQFDQDFKKNQFGESIAC